MYYIQKRNYLKSNYPLSPDWNTFRFYFFMFDLLNLFLLLIPGVPVLWLIQISKSNKLSYQIGLSYSIYLYLITLLLLWYYNPNSGFQYTTTFFNFSIGVDGVSLWLIFLVNLITPIIVLNGYRNLNLPSNNKEYLILILLINYLSLLVFVALDLFLFYISFEGILIPIFLLIGSYGSRNRKIYADYLLFIYTLIGSLLFLFTIIYIYIETGTSDYQLILQYGFTKREEMILFWPVFLSMIVKLPVVPLHTWLPNAHTEAPSGGSVILAAILLKFGTYGILRFLLPLFPSGVLYYGPIATTIAILSILVCSIGALSLIDIKQVIAYSSIIHMNVSLVGLFSNDLNGILGGFLYTISHGLIASGLFLLAGVLYERYHTRVIKYYRGLVLIMPSFIATYLFFCLSNISFPTTAGFVPEMLIYFSSLKISWVVTMFVTLVILSLPFYFIWTLHKIGYGQMSSFLQISSSDLTIKELHIFGLLFALILVFGIFPSIIIDVVLLDLSR